MAHAKQDCRIRGQEPAPGDIRQAGFVEAGGLMSYGTNHDRFDRRTAYVCGQDFERSQARRLPVEQPTKFELFINLKAAKQIGLTIPPNVLARADKVIK